MKNLFFVFAFFLFFSCKEKKSESSILNTKKDSVASTELNQDIPTLQLNLSNGMPYGVSFGATMNDVKSNMKKDSMLSENENLITYTYDMNEDFWDSSFEFDSISKKYKTFYLDYYTLDSNKCKVYFDNLMKLLSENSETFGSLEKIDSTVWEGETKCCITHVELINVDDDLGYQLLLEKK